VIFRPPTLEAVLVPDALGDMVVLLKGNEIWSGSWN